MLFDMKTFKKYFQRLKIKMPSFQMVKLSKKKHDEFTEKS